MSRPHALDDAARREALTRLGYAAAMQAMHTAEGCPGCAMGILMYGAAAIAEEADLLGEFRHMLQTLTLKLHQGEKQ